MARQVNASKEVKRLKEELDGMIKKKLEIEKELAKEKAKKADELKEKLEVATKEIEKLEGKVKALKTELEAARKEGAKALAEVEARFKSELGERLEELKASLLAQGSKDAEAALEALKDRLEQDKQAALAEMGAKHAAALATQEAAQASLRVQMDEMKKEHDEALVKLQAEAERQRREALENAEKSASATMAGLLLVEKNKLKAAEKEHAAAQEAAARERAEAEEAARAAAAQALEEEKDRAASLLREELARMADERRAGEEQLANERTEAEAAAAAEHASQVAGLEGQLEDARGEIGALTRKVEGLESEIEALRGDVRARDDAMVEEKELAARALADEQARLKAEKKVEMDAMLEEHLNETKELHEEFTQAQGLLQVRRYALECVSVCVCVCVCVCVVLCYVNPTHGHHRVCGG